MMHRLRKVTDEFYRGSAPSPSDVAWLKENLGINKVVSLDEETGKRIDRACKLMGIEHIMLPINMHHVKPDVVKLLKHDLKKLFLEDGPTFVHCAEGKDRTGFAVALVQCKFLGKDPEEAIEEAKSLGFGLDVPPKPIQLFEKLIRSCKPDKDSNSVDIVSREREYISDNRDSFLDEGHQGSFAPYLNQTRQNPMDALYNFIMEQNPTRENYHHGKPIKEYDPETDEIPEGVPAVGVYNNDAGGRGFGPVEPNPGGFIHD